MSVIADTWQHYLDLLDTAPLLTRSVTAGLLFPAADVLAQLIERNQKSDQDDEGSPLLRQAQLHHTYFRMRMHRLQC
jgi:hypothetical protein